MICHLASTSVSDLSTILERHSMTIKMFSNNNNISDILGKPKYDIVMWSKEDELVKKFLTENHILEYDYNIGILFDVYMKDYKMVKLFVNWMEKRNGCAYVLLSLNYIPTIALRVIHMDTSWNEITMYCSSGICSDEVIRQAKTVMSKKLKSIEIPDLFFEGVTSTCMILNYGNSNE